MHSRVGVDGGRLGARVIYRQYPFMPSSWVWCVGEERGSIEVVRA